MNNNEMPKLIVALNKYGEYVHIRDVDKQRRDEEVFNCPVCLGRVKGRCVDDTTVKKPHFYHIDTSCSEESIAHWIYKNWLLKDGVVFETICKDKHERHEVDSIEIEKTHKTKYGDYRPDITVNTKSGKTIFFEIKYSGGKNKDDYYSKWQDLDIDVVEVNVKTLLQEDYDKNDICFNLIYSNYVCYMRDYKGRDYSLCKRKEEIKRQDALNYKARIERIDWFFIELQKYHQSPTEENEDLIIESYKALGDCDREFVFDFVKKHENKSLKNKISIALDNMLYDNIWVEFDKLNMFLEENRCNHASLKKGRIYFTFMYEEEKITEKIDNVQNIIINKFNEIHDNVFIKENIKFISDIKLLNNSMFDFVFNTREVLMKIKIGYLNKLAENGLEYDAYYHFYTHYNSRSIHCLNKYGIRLHEKDFVKNNIEKFKIGFIGFTEDYNVLSDYFGLRITRKKDKLLFK